MTFDVKKAIGELRRTIDATEKTLRDQEIEVSHMKQMVETLTRDLEQKRVDLKEAETKLSRLHAEKGQHDLELRRLEQDLAIKSKSL